MITKTVEEGDLKVTVSQANGVMGNKRRRLGYEQSQIEDTDQDSRITRIIDYPNLVACSDIRPDFDTFAAMPDAFLARWAEAVYELNPHWHWSAGASEKKATT